ncbi:MAG: hypothetical protein LBF39_04225, partial [Prevotellaceae bacterium]|nr:hypothetical protein [Prevotellaceae bacterium]
MSVKYFIVSVLVVAGFLFATPAEAHTVLAEKGKPKGRIIVTTHHAADEQAALLLQDFVRRISGARLAILHDGTPQKGDVAIGNGTTNYVVP